jgi:hypothetical protein
VFAAEAALNWQAENTAAQNRSLQRIEKNQKSLTEKVSHKPSTLESLIFELKAKIESLRVRLGLQFKKYVFKIEILKCAI